MTKQYVRKRNPWEKVRKAESKAQILLKIKYKVYKKNTVLFKYYTGKGW